MNKTSEVNIDEVKETADNSTFIGEVKQGFLTESQMQAQAGIGWVLCNGQNVAGSAYEIVTGNIAVPDLRGQFLRGLDNMRGVDVGRAMGSEQGDAFQGHRHSFYDTGGGGSWSHSTSNVAETDNRGGSNNHTLDPITDSTNGTPRTAEETRPTNVAINFFIRIN